MSEALDDIRYLDRRPSPQARLQFTPDIELRGYLHRFIREESLESLGRSGLFLYADSPIVAGRQSAGLSARAGTESSVHSAINRELRTRGTRHTELARRLQFMPMDKDAPGTVLSFDVILHELTAGAVMNHMKVNPDRSVGAHVTIPREIRVGKQAFLAASRELYERLLDDTTNPGIDKIDLIFPRSV